MAYVELPGWVNEATVEKAHWFANWALRNRRHDLADRAMVLAKERNDKLLKALEGGATLPDRVAERQMGRTRRDPGTPYSQQVELTESSLWREAYRMADQGTALENFQWIYVGAARLAGLLDA